MRPTGRGVAAAVTVMVLTTALAIGCASVPIQRTGDVELVRTNSEVPGAWYAGDLHCHSTHSDGDSAVETVMARAEEQGLDFFVITDHDTDMRGVPTHWNDEDYRSDRMVLLYGVEWTSKRGHGNVISTKPFDYNELWTANRDLDGAAAVAAARGRDALFSINHPICDCCAWEYGLESDEGIYLADTLEVWNGPFNYPNDNKETVYELWDGMLSRGLRVNAVGGSDNHRLTGLESRFNPHGSPTTWVYAADRSAEAIMAGIRSGRVAITYQAFGDRLELLADSDGNGRFEAMMGDEIPPGRETTFGVAVMGPGGSGAVIGAGRRYTCVVYKNGEVFRRLSLRSGRSEGAVFTDTPLAGDYYRAVLRGSPKLGLLRRLVLGRTLALTNPIYVRD